MKLDDIKEEYLSQIRGVFPLHRATILFIALVVVVAVRDFKYKSTALSLLQVKLRSFADLDKGFFATVTLEDALIAIILLAFGAISHRLLRWLSFLWIKKQLNLDAVIKEMSGKSMERRDGTIESYFALKKSEVQSKNWGKKISSLSQLSESTFALCFTFLYAGYFGSFIDVAIGLGFFVFAVLALARSFIIFLKYYLPHTTHIKGNLGDKSQVTLP